MKKTFHFFYTCRARYVANALKNNENLPILTSLIYQVIEESIVNTSLLMRTKQTTNRNDALFILNPPLGISDSSRDDVASHLLSSSVNRTTSRRRLIPPTHVFIQQNLYDTRYSSVPGWGCSYGTTTLRRSFVVPISWYLRMENIASGLDIAPTLAKDRISHPHQASRQQY